jgi:hypothetical protein
LRRNSYGPSIHFRRQYPAKGTVPKAKYKSWIRWYEWVLLSLLFGGFGVALVLLAIGVLLSVV